MDYTCKIRHLAYNEALDYLIIELSDEGDFKNKKIVVSRSSI